MDEITEFTNSFENFKIELFLQSIVYNKQSIDYYNQSLQKLRIHFENYEITEFTNSFENFFFMLFFI